ncbi:dna topoisomerase, partial [Cystoisospora suis]
MSSSEDEDSFSSPSPSPSQQKENKKKAANTKTIEQRYQKKSQLEHILLRPDTYIGSTEVHTQQLWVMEDAEGSEQSPSMTFKTINYVPGLYKIVDEILVNAADVKAREGEEKKDKPIKPGARRMSAIKIDINSQTGRISIWNDGE